MSVYKDSNGNWVSHFRYKDWQGKIVQKKKSGFKTKKEAQNFETNFLNSLSNSVNITLGNLVEEYLADFKIRYKPTTYNTKSTLFKTKIIPTFKNKPIGEITSNDIRRWQTKLVEEGFSSTYLRLIHNQMSALFNYAIKYYKLPSNPAAQCGSMGKKKSDKLQFWTKTEFDKFMSKLDDERCKVIFPLLFYSGIREGEMFALTQNDFNFETNTVRINKTYARLNCQDIIQKPKTPKSNRTVTLPKEIAQLVKTYIEKQKDLKSTDRLFIINKTTLGRILQSTAEKVGIKKIRVHDLRHSHASLLIEMGVTPLLISERLGHENIETTLNTYSHLYPNKDATVANMISDIL